MFLFIVMKSLKTVIEDLHKLLAIGTQLTAELKHLSTLAVFNVSITVKICTVWSATEYVVYLVLPIVRFINTPN